MEPILLALAPPLPLSAKAGIAVIMTILASGLSISFGRIGSWRLLVAMTAVSIAAIIVITLDLSFPDRFNPGLDGRGVLAALIGLFAGGACRPWFKHKTQ